MSNLSAFSFGDPGPHTRGQVEVRAESFATLNGRPAQRLIDPHVNLAGPLPPNWILPLRRASAITPEFAQRVFEPFKPPER
jgi:hypothetical protein